MQAREYDETDPISIEEFAQRLIGMTFADVCRADERSKEAIIHDEADYDKKHSNKRRKGGLGEIIEERFFHYPCNNDARPDFEMAGVELKVSPYRIKSDGSKVAKERLILTMIDYFNVINETFENSHMWAKAQLILLIYYLYQSEISDRLDYRIDYAKLFSPPEEDVEIIKHDYDVIVQKIRAGKAHELSEADTLYLGAATKAATSKDRRKQPFSAELAKPRAFTYKNAYMTYVLNNYIIPGKATYERIAPKTLAEPFEEYVCRKINEYRGYSIDELCQIFNLEGSRKAKNLPAIIAFRILGVKGNHAEEFEKAGIAVKTIRIGHNGKIKENMSFPYFKFKELAAEEWETSSFGTYLSETRFLFVVYRFDENSILHLCGCQFWNIPYEDLETNVRSVWEKTKQTIISGLQVEVINGENHTNLPKQAENPVCHVRPHARNAKDTDELPDGRMFPKQCFWLNNSYILAQIGPELKL